MASNQWAARCRMSTSRREQQSARRQCQCRPAPASSTSAPQTSSASGSSSLWTSSMGLLWSGSAQVSSHPRGSPAEPVDRFEIMGQLGSVRLVWIIAGGCSESSDAFVHLCLLIWSGCAAAAHDETTGGSHLSDRATCSAISRCAIQILMDWWPMDTLKGMSKSARPINQMGDESNAATATIT